MSRSITKAQLVQELSSKLDVPAAQAELFLRTLNEIAYREAENGFIIPNLCKIEMVDRKPRRCRDPRTGAHLMVGARKGVRIRPLKKARDTIAPMPPNIVTVLNDPKKESAEKKAAAAETEKPLTPITVGEPPPVHPKVIEPTPQPEAPTPPPEKPAVGETEPEAEEPAAASTEFVYFRCDACNQEIEAPADMVGLQAECPACNAPVVVKEGEPEAAEEPLVPHTSDSEAAGDEAEQSEMDQILFDAMKKRTIRIELPEADPIQTQPKKKFVFKKPRR